MRNRQTAGLAVVAAPLVSACVVLAVSAQTANPRIGRWKLKQDAPPPAINIMTYEAIPHGGMKVTVDSVNGQGRENHWTYITMFDGKDMPVTGHPSADTTSVRRIDERTNEIVNKKGGRVIQVITNVISVDGRTIDNTYKNYNDKGEVTSTTTAVYEKQSY
jgi:hypothetical protein